MTVRIAMWSGPRNISTAMMRSWENRSDCSVVDEPFYACYLHETGLNHPCRDEILAAQSTSREAVIRQLTQGEPGSGIYYQKHMTHHMPRGMDMGWCADMVHCFLIRNPREVIVSYLEKMPRLSEDDIGIVRQAELFDEITAIQGLPPLVVDSADVLRDPAAVLEKLCAGLGVPWLPDAMLSWPPGRRESDGVWAPHWYQNVESSTGFGKHRHRDPQVPAQHEALAKRMQSYYLRLAEHRLMP